LKQERGANVAPLKQDTTEIVLGPAL
jgi:hypothetical protein